MNFSKLYFLALACYLGMQTKTLTIEPEIFKITTENAPEAIGPYSQALRAGDYLFISGQLGIDPLTKKFTGETAEEQTRQVLKNMEGILNAAGGTFKNVVKTEVYLKDLNDFQAMNKVYAEAFSHEIEPTRLTIQAAKLPLDGLVEIVCIAYIPAK